jgi:hypothetical protein
MTKSRRAVAVTAPLVVLLAVIVWAFFWLISYPATVQAAAAGSSGDVNVTLQTVGALGTGSHPSWVSYLIQQPNGQWVHSTVLQVPAHSTVHVTVQQYDTGSDLRNPVMNQVLGTVGGTETVDGKTDSTWTDSVGHTFTIPDLGLSVPLPGIADDAKNPCSAAPCTPDFDHHTVQFSFTTQGPGTYTWQCFVPCAAGYYAGFGGPMSTVGFMNGVLKVVG